MGAVSNALLTKTGSFHWFCPTLPMCPFYCPGTHTHTHTHDLTGFSIERLGKRAREMLPCALAVCDRGLWDTSSDVYVTCKKEK